MTLDTHRIGFFNMSTSSNEFFENIYILWKQHLKLEFFFKDLSASAHQQKDLSEALQSFGYYKQTAQNIPSKSPPSLWPDRAGRLHFQED
jgi:hypothetical protein